VLHILALAPEILQMEKLELRPEKYDEKSSQACFDREAEAGC
jgi:hypothetical protein